MKSEFLLKDMDNPKLLFLKKEERLICQSFLITNLDMCDMVSFGSFFLRLNILFSRKYIYELKFKINKNIKIRFHIQFPLFISVLFYFLNAEFLIKYK